MATFSQFLASRASGKWVPRPFTWCAGGESVLAAEVSSAIRGSLSSPVVSSFTAGADAEADIWNAVAQYPADGELRFTIIQDAHLLSGQEIISGLLAARIAGMFTVFLTREAGSHPVRDLIQGSARGQVIRCVLGAPAARENWVASQLPEIASQALPAAILTAAGGDLGYASGICAKLVLCQDLLGNPAREAALAWAYRSYRAEEDFSDSLLAGDKRNALRSIPPHQSMGAAFALLSSRLDTLAALRAAGPETPARDLVTKHGIPQFLVSRYRKLSPAYPPSAVRARRRVLAEADSQWRAGVREGLAEWAVALW